MRVCEGRAAQSSLPRGKVGEPGAGVPLVPSEPSGVDGLGPATVQRRGQSCLSRLGGIGSIVTFVLRSGELLRAFAHGGHDLTFCRLLDGVLRVDFVVQLRNLMSVRSSCSHPDRMVAAVRRSAQVWRELAGVSSQGRHGGYEMRRKGR